MAAFAIGDQEGANMAWTSVRISSVDGIEWDADYKIRASTKAAGNVRTHPLDVDFPSYTVLVQALPPTHNQFYIELLISRRPQIGF